MSYTVLQDNVMILRDLIEEKTAGGIILPGTAKEKKAYTGVVKGVGPGAYHDTTGAFHATTVKVGQRVLFGNRPKSDQEIDVEGERLIVMRERDLIAVYDNVASTLE